MSPAEQEDAVREFVRSFNAGDLDAFVRILDPEIELDSMKGGLLEGIGAAREWATREPGGVQQTVVIEAIKSRDQFVLADIRRDWHWAEDETLAASDEMAWLFGCREGRIRSWRPFGERAEGAAAFDGA